MWSVISVQWIGLVALSVLVVGLMREVGLMQLKIGPPGAMAAEQGVPVGAEVQPQLVEALDGRSFTLPTHGVPNLVVFLSPTCGVCHQLIDPVRVMARYERDLAVTVVCASDEQPCREFLGHMGGRVAVLADPRSEIKQRFGITGSSFAQIFDRDGVAGPSGIVNNLAHLESLLRSLQSDGRVALAAAPPVGPAGLEAALDEALVAKEA